MRFFVVACFCCFFLSSPTAQTTGPEQWRQMAEKDEVEGWWRLAQWRLDQQSADYQPDSAFVFVREAQSALRRLKKSKQKRLARQGIDRRALSRLRRQAQSEALDFAIATGRSAAVDAYLSRYDRLSYELETKAYVARNKLALSEAVATGSYDSLLVFRETYRNSLEHHSRSLLATIDTQALRLFVAARDTTDLRALAALLRDFPQLAGRLDGALSRAYRRHPSPSYIEEQLADLPKSSIPLTVAELYASYTYEGDIENLLTFNSRYPAYGEAFALKEEFSIARRAPDFGLEYSEDQRAAYEAYIREAAPRFRAFRALQRLIAEDVRSARWDDAREIVRRFQPHFGADDAPLRQLLALLSAPAPAARPESIADSINSVYSEYAPVIAADDRLLFFCRRIEHEDIYVSHKQADGWGPPLPLSALNSPENEAPLGISADRATLLFFDNGAVKTTERAPGGWTPPEAFLPAGEGFIWQGGTTLSADRQVAIFAGRRSDVIGPIKAENENIDLYLTRRDSTGRWGEAVNLGPVINTPFEDRGPFLHPDMKTLYFSSDGHGGFGGLDVYKTTRLDDTWTNWSQPVNLGKVFNDPGRNWGYKVSTDGSYAYFATARSDRRSDIFRIELPDELRPDTVFTIAGTLRDLDGHPVVAEILVEDLTSGKTVGKFKSDPGDGSFFFTLTAGKLYSYVVQRDHFFPVAGNLDLRQPADSLAFRRDLTIPRIDELAVQGLSLTLNNLFFDTDKYDIRSESFPELDRLAQLIRRHQLEVTIAGHTDSVGGKEYNQQLSQNRAEAVRAYLVEKGCPAGALNAQGYGMTQPVAANDTPEGRARNRRVEIRFRSAEE